MCARFPPLLFSTLKLLYMLSKIHSDKIRHCFDYLDSAKLYFSPSNIGREYEFRIPMPRMSPRSGLGGGFDGAFQVRARQSLDLKSFLFFKEFFKIM